MHTSRGGGLGTEGTAGLTLNRVHKHLTSTIWTRQGLQRSIHASLSIQTHITGGNKVLGVPHHHLQMSHIHNTMVVHNLKLDKNKWLCLFWINKLFLLFFFITFKLQYNHSAWSTINQLKTRQDKQKTHISKTEESKAQCFTIEKPETISNTLKVHYKCFH